MKIALLDDEDYWLRKIKTYIDNEFIDLKAQITAFLLADNLLSSDSEYDLVFLDVELGHDSGFDVAYKFHSLHPDTTLCFLTSHAELCNIGYRYEAFRYINKEHFKEELSETLTAFCKKYSCTQAILVTSRQYGVHTITIKDISYIESSGKNSIIHLKRGELAVLDTMFSLEEKLSGNYFFRCHRAYLVNLAFVKNYDKSSLTLTTGVRLLISRRKYSELNDSYFKFKFETANR